MLLVSLIEVQLVHSVVTHRGIAVVLILTQGFVSMAIDSPAAAARTHIYKRRVWSLTKKTQQPHEIPKGKKRKQKLSK